MYNYIYFMKFIIFEIFFFFIIDAIAHATDEISLKIKSISIVSPIGKIDRNPWKKKTFSEYYSSYNHITINLT